MLTWELETRYLVRHLVDEGLLAIAKIKAQERVEELFQFT